MDHSQWRRMIISILDVRYSFPSVFWHCWLSDRKGIRPVKSRVLVCWWWQFDWSFARLIAPVVTATSIVLNSSKIQTGDILILANPGPPAKMAVKTERYNSDSGWWVFSCDWHQLVQVVLLEFRLHGLAVCCCCYCTYGMCIMNRQWMNVKPRINVY